MPGSPSNTGLSGEGSCLDAVAYARHEMGLEESVSFLGPLPPTAVKREMLWADVFLHAAVSEGFCNAVIEAQAMKLPVVCTDADGLPENVCEGETGFVVPRRDPEAMALGISRLAADPSLRERMGRAGRQSGRETFSDRGPDRGVRPGVRETLGRMTAPVDLVWLGPAEDAPPWSVRLGVDCRIVPGGRGRSTRPASRAPGFSSMGPFLGAFRGQPP